VVEVYSLVITEFGSHVMNIDTFAWFDVILKFVRVQWSSAQVVC
jgi:hypothetical protein